MSSEQSFVGRVSSPGAVTARRRVAVDFDGPYRSENPATFRDYRFDLLLENLQSGETMLAPGFFAADGRAGETGATSGAVWRACFAPPSEGLWRYQVRLRRAVDIALLDPDAMARGAGEPAAPVDGMEGVLDVGKSGPPGSTPEGAFDLSAAGALEEQGERLRIPCVDKERPRLALANWRGLLASDAFDDPVSDDDGAPLILSASYGVAPIAGPAPVYAGALRLVEAMASAAAEKGAGLVRLDLFPAEAATRAVGPWKEAIRRRREAVDPFSFDVSRLDQWDALLERMAARGLAIELRLDPPDPAEAAAFWREPVARPVRRVLLRELSARFGGLGAVIWRGRLGDEDRAFAAEIDPRRAKAPWDVVAPAVDLNDDEAGPAGSIEAGASSQGRETEKGKSSPPAASAFPPPSTSGPATPPEPPAVATRPPPSLNSGNDMGAFLEAAGAAAATAARRLGGLLKDVVGAAEEKGETPSADFAVGQSTVRDPLSAPGPGASPVSVGESVAPAAEASSEQSSSIESASESEPTSGGEDIPAVVACAAPLPRLEVADLSTRFGEADVEASLFRLDNDVPAPEADTIESPDGLDLSGFKTGETGLIVRFAGADAARVKEARIWLRRLKNVSDELVPPASDEDPLRHGPPPKIEKAEPFALFGDISRLADACGGGVVQLVVEALAARKEAGEPASARLVRRWALPVACNGGLAAALLRLRGESAAGQTDASALNGAAAPPSEIEHGELDEALAAKIRETPQTEAPHGSALAAKDENADADPKPDAADGEQALKDDTAETSADVEVASIEAPKDGEPPEDGDVADLAIPEPPNEAEADSAPGGPNGAKKPGRRPIFFGALVSEARRRAGPAQGSREADEAVQAWAQSPPLAPRRPRRDKPPLAPKKPQAEGTAQDGPSAQAFKPPLAPRRPEGSKPPLAPKRPETPETTPSSPDVVKSDFSAQSSPEPSKPNTPAPDAAAPVDNAALSLLRLELIDADTDRRIAFVRDGASLPEDAVLSKRITVKATLAGSAASTVNRLRVTLEGDQLAQRAVDRPQPSEDERVGMFYGLTFQAGEAGLVIEALQDEDGAEKPVFVERRKFRVE